MRVRVLGCSGAIAQGCRTTSFLINHNILIDAGTGVGDLTLEEMRRIDHVFLTHSHLDHIAALPLMLDSVSSLRNQPVQVHALPATIAALQAHVFNNTIWPDFSRIPSVQSPLLQFAPLVEGDLVCVDGPPSRCCQQSTPCLLWATPCKATVLGGYSQATPNTTQPCGPSWKLCVRALPPNRLVCW